jgi:serine/threonine protein kinase
MQYFFRGFNSYGETSGTNDGYNAPEVGKQICTRRADIYSLGCVFKDLLSFRYDDILHRHQDSTCQRDPYMGGSLIELLSSSSDNGSAEIVKLVGEKMIEINPNSRPTAVLMMKNIIRSAKQIPWFDGRDAIISEELNYPGLSDDGACRRRGIFNWNL